MEPITSGDLRIVMLGMTGAGKSATGNTILGSDEFKVDFSPDSVTQQSERKLTRKDGRLISIIDTPGLQDPKRKENEVKAEIKRCLDMSSPGPNVFLLVIRLDDRFTEEKKNTVRWIQKNFGEEAARFTIVLFTHADSLRNKPLKELLEDSPDLRQLIISCGGRYHAVNNEDRINQNQVNELLLKMDQMVLRNAGKHYTDVMYSKAQIRLDWWESVIAALAAVIIAGVAAAAAGASGMKAIEVVAGILLLIAALAVTWVALMSIKRIVQATAEAIMEKL